jgi:hypothetical protein
MPTPQSLQSDRADQLRVVADDAGSACWEICSGGICLRDRSGPSLMERYRALLVSQGRAVPIS